MLPELSHYHLYLSTTIPQHNYIQPNSSLQRPLLPIIRVLNKRLINQLDRHFAAQHTIRIISIFSTCSQGRQKLTNSTQQARPTP
jgi:hypothetical protein